MRTIEDDIKWMNTVHNAQREAVAQQESKLGRKLGWREKHKVEGHIKDAFQAVDRAGSGQ